MQNLSSLTKKYKYLAIIIFIFFTIESIWIITTPIFSTPDSPVRFKNIQNYAKGKNTPVISEPSPLYYSIAGNLDKVFLNTRVSSQVKFLEFLSAIFSVITIIFAYKISEILFSDTKIAIVNTLTLAIFPMFSYLGMSIDLDALLIALYTAFIYYSLKILKEGLNKKNFTIITIILFLGLLTKQNMYLNILFYAGIIIYELYRKKLLKLYTKYIVGGAILALAFLVIFNTGFKSVVLPQVQALFNNNNSYSILDYTFYNFHRFYNGLIFKSFWGVYGYLIINLQLRIYYLLEIVSIVSVLGISIKIFNYIKEKKLNKYIIYILLQFFITFLFLYTLDFIRVKDYSGYFTVGRYFFPILSLLIIGFISGLKMFISKKYYDQFYFILISLMILFNAYSIFMINYKFFAT